MNEDKLTAQEIMQETGWTFCKYNEEATRKETEAAIDEVIMLYEQCIQEIQEQARLLGMSAERELSLLAEIEQLKKIINKLVAQNGSESIISLLWGRTKG